MKNFIIKYKPTVSKLVLLFIAGIMWASIGIMMISKAVHWLYIYEGNSWLYSISGFIAALIITKFGFSKIVIKNISRIAQLPEKPCIFSFISLKSYLIIIFMITLGITLRNSVMPKQYLSVIYISIGLSLFLSNFRYFLSIYISKKFNR